LTCHLSEIIAIWRHFLMCLWPKKVGINILVICQAHNKILYHFSEFCDTYGICQNV
jgi:hypothetical protein